jgi:hypothetical protein
MFCRDESVGVEASAVDVVVFPRHVTASIYRQRPTRRKRDIASNAVKNNMASTSVSSANSGWRSTRGVRGARNPMRSQSYLSPSSLKTLCAHDAAQNPAWTHESSGAVFPKTRRPRRFGVPATGRSSDREERMQGPGGGYALLALPSPCSSRLHRMRRRTFGLDELCLRFVYNSASPSTRPSSADRLQSRVKDSR